MAHIDSISPGEHDFRCIWHHMDHGFIFIPCFSVFSLQKRHKSNSFDIYSCAFPPTHFVILFSLPKPCHVMLLELHTRLSCSALALARTISGVSTMLVNFSLSAGVRYKLSLRMSWANFTLFTIGDSFGIHPIPRSHSRSDLYTACERKYQRDRIKSFH